MSNTTPLPFVMIGGGISGLALTYWLRRAEIDARLIEKGPVAGGVMQTVERDGFIFERGPNTILDKLPVVDELIEQLNLGEHVNRTELKTQDRYIWRAKKLWAVPHGPGEAIKSALFSAGAKLRLAREFMVSPVGEDESLRDFVIRRFGEQPYERAFLPMVQGLWAGDPAKMSTALSFPVLKELEHEAGGIIKGMIQRQKASSGTKRSTSMVGFTRGLQTLAAGLASELGEGLRLESEVKSIRELSEGGFAVEVQSQGQNETLIAERVGVSGDARGVAKLLRGFDDELSNVFESIHYCPLAVAAIGIPSGSANIPDGFGFLAQREEGLRLLGAIFNSNFMPNNAPEGQAALTIMLGGDLDPEVVGLDDETILKILRDDLGKAIGWNGELTTHEITRWERAIPQYHMGHHEVLEKMTEAETRHPGLHLFGNWRGGTAIPERIQQAKELADEININTITHEPVER